MTSINTPANVLMPATCLVRAGSVSTRSDLATVGGERPDDDHVQCDDQDRPDRVVGYEREVDESAERCQHDAGHDSPCRALDDADTRERHQHTEDQVDPTPA